MEIRRRGFSNSRAAAALIYKPKPRCARAAVGGILPTEFIDCISSSAYQHHLTEFINWDFLSTTILNTSIHVLHQWARRQTFLNFRQKWFSAEKRLEQINNSHGSVFEHSNKWRSYIQYSGSSSTGVAVSSAMQWSPCIGISTFCRQCRAISREFAITLTSGDPSTLFAAQNELRRGLLGEKWTCSWWLLAPHYAASCENLIGPYCAHCCAWDA